MQGRKEGGKEGTMYPAPHHLGTLKIPNNVASTFFNTFRVLRKTLGSNMGATNSFIVLGAKNQQQYPPGWLTYKTNLATCCQKSSVQSLFFHTLFEAWVAKCSNSDLGRACISLGTVM